MVLSAMVVFTVIVPVAGYLSDKGLRRVNSTIVICVVAALTSIPMFLAFRTKHLAACWLLQIFTLSLTAYTVCCIDVSHRFVPTWSPLY
jgi:MFS family permease